MPGYDRQKIDDLFGHHDIGPRTRDEFAEIRHRFRDFAHWVKRHVPDCPLQTTAINKLFEAKNAAGMALLTAEAEAKRECAAAGKVVIVEGEDGSE